MFNTVSPSKETFDNRDPRSSYVSVGSNCFLTCLLPLGQARSHLKTFLACSLLLSQMRVCQKLREEYEMMQCSNTFTILYAFILLFAAFLVVFHFICALKT